MLDHIGIRVSDYERSKRYFEMGVEVARHPHVCQWYDRLALRPGFRQHVMVRFDELRGRIDY